MTLRERREKDMKWSKALWGALLVTVIVGAAVLAAEKKGREKERGG
jgi:hypothetical protein